MIVALIGLPGSGKSTVGRHLARRLNVPFSDSDQVIEQRIGCSIRDYFDQQGELAFRNIEETVICQLIEHGGYQILATGGGVVMREGSRACLRRAAYVIYLHASVEEVFRRVRRDTRRPLLQVDKPLDHLRDLYAERDPLYRGIAHFTLETGQQSAAVLVDAIKVQLESSGLLHFGNKADPPDR